MNRSKSILGWRSISLLVAYVIVLAVMSWQTVVIVRKAAIEDLRDASSNKLTLFLSNLTSELEKYEFLPQILAQDERIIRLFEKPRDPAYAVSVNEYLEQVNRISSASDIYVIDQNGSTLVASNWRSQTPFVGENFAFRPYFQAALRGEIGRYYALGATSKKRGYYYASPIKVSGKIAGVAVVKVSPERVEAAWSDVPERVIVTDYHGVVFITNYPDWRLKTLHRLAPEVLKEIEESRQYLDEVTTPLRIVDEELYGDGVVLLTVRESAAGGEERDSTYLAQSSEMTDHKWLVHMLTDFRPVQTRVIYAAGYAVLSVTAVFLIFMYLMQRGRHQRHIEETLLNAQKELEAKVEHRTLELIETNRQLDQKVKQQEITELDLRNTQEELVQSAKLALLGQMSAGITHELNQPLTAIQTYVGTAQQLLKRGYYDELDENLSSVLALTRRMARFTNQLRSFTRKSTQNITEVSIRQVVGEALTLITHTHNLEIEVIESYPEEEIFVLADVLRLEQVLVNIFKNAVDAMKHSKNPRLYLSIYTSAGMVNVDIKDSGTGIPEAHLSKLFDPFFTSKEAGAGLGLGLSISREIISGFGGSIEAGNDRNGGAVFKIKLPMARTEPLRMPSASILVK